MRLDTVPAEEGTDAGGPVSVVWESAAAAATEPYPIEGDDRLIVVVEAEQRRRTLQR